MQSILGVDIIPGGGGGRGSKTPNFGRFRVMRILGLPRYGARERVDTWITSFARGTKTAFYRSCFIFGPLIGAATHERHSVDNRLDIRFFCFFVVGDSLSIVFSSRKPGDSYPKIDRSRRTLAKNDLPSSGADV